MAIKVIFQALDLGVGRTLGMLETRMRNLQTRFTGFGSRAVQSMNRVADGARRLGERIQALAFNLSFMGFIVQFISFITIIMMQRISNAVFQVIEKVSNWREAMVTLAGGIVAANAILGRQHEVTDFLITSFENLLTLGPKLEQFQGLIQGLITAAQIKFIEGLLGGDPGEQLKEWLDKFDKEGFENTMKAIGDAFKPFMESLLGLLELLSDPKKSEGLVLFANMLANFLGGIVEGIPVINKMFQAVDKLLTEIGWKDWKDTLFGIVKAVGSMLPAFVVLGTVLSVSGPILISIGMATGAFGGLLKVMITFVARLFGIRLAGTAFQRTMDTYIISSANRGTTSIGRFRGALGRLGSFMRGFGRRGAIAGGAILAGAGAAALATGGLEGLQKGFLDQATTMEEKIKAIGGVAALSFGVAIEIATFFPALGKFALIGAAIATATAILIIFKKELVEFATKALKFVSEKIEEFGGAVIGFFEWIGKTVAFGSIWPDMWNEIKNVTEESLEDVENTTAKKLQDLAGQFTNFRDIVTDAMVGTGSSLKTATAAAGLSLSGAADSLKGSIDRLTGEIAAPRIARETRIAELERLVSGRQGIQERLQALREQRPRTFRREGFRRYGFVAGASRVFHGSRMVPTEATAALDAQIRELQAQLGAIDRFKRELANLVGMQLAFSRFGGLPLGSQQELFMQGIMSAAGVDVLGTPLIPGLIQTIPRTSRFGPIPPQFSGIRLPRTPEEFAHFINQGIIPPEFIQGVIAMTGMQPNFQQASGRSGSEQAAARSVGQQISTGGIGGPPSGGPNIALQRGGIIVGERGPELMVLPNRFMRKQSLMGGMNGQPITLQVFLETDGGFTKIIDQRLDDKVTESRRLYRGRAVVD